MGSPHTNVVEPFEQLVDAIAGEFSRDRRDGLPGPELSVNAVNHRPLRHSPDPEADGLVGGYQVRQGLLVLELRRRPLLGLGAFGGGGAGGGGRVDFEAGPAMAGYWEGIFTGDVPTGVDEVLPQLLMTDTIDLEGNELRVIKIGQADTAESTVLYIPSLSAVVASTARTFDLLI